MARLNRFYAIIVVLAVVLVLAGCSQKGREPFRDAPTAGHDNSPALILEMPDGFSNLATKCDGPNRVYVIFKGNANRGAVAVVPNDPRCRGGS